MAEPTNTPMPPGTPISCTTPRSSPPPVPYVADADAALDIRPVVLHIGDPVRYNPSTYALFSTSFRIVRPHERERRRPEFVRALRERRWGDFHAIFRPFWGSGGEMGPWDRELIDLLPPSVRVFASAGAGFDWADARLLGFKGIIYCNSAPAAAESVADLAVAMVISTFRHTSWCLAAATFGSAQDFQTCHSQAPGTSHTLRGKTLGIIGYGNIGTLVAAKLGCPAFGMDLHIHDVKEPPHLPVPAGARFHPILAGLLAAVDCVVLCVPARPDGRPIIGAAELRLLRPGARFVNVARGSLVDEDALADALEEGRVGAAALDVHASEPAVSARLRRMAADVGGRRPGRVMLTCHNAGGTVETHAGFEELSMRNILAVLSGGDAITPVNLRWLKSVPET